MAPTARRVTRRAAVALGAVALTTCSVAVAAPADAAARYVRTVTVVEAASHTARVTTTATASATARAGVPVASVTERASGRGSATATARRTARSSATVRAASPARAAALARTRAARAARAAATVRARTAARAAAAAVARQRALAAARRNAQQAAAAAVTAKVSGGTTTSAPTASGTPCGGVTPDGTANWTCTFSDDFTGTALDRTKWSAVTSADSGFVTNLAECFVDSPQNIAVSDGTLKLTTRAQANTCQDGLRGTRDATWTSGSVSSIGKFSQAYGTFSVRAKFPATTAAGLHSAIWMWPQDATKYGAWPLSGELDIAERYSVHPDRAIPFMHYDYDATTALMTAVTGDWSQGFSVTGTNVDTNNFCTQTDPDGWHTYSMTWTPTSVSIVYDGRLCLANTYSALGLAPGAPFDSPFFMILTQSLGVAGTQNAPTAATPQVGTTEVDWVRAWAAR
ncbi:glycoside hydrolase family 16 protein [Jatrophihabitans fulvus]